jgi:7,8-dihydro-6-hydroxymethylpterin-pyrophosphokinase
MTTNREEREAEIRELAKSFLPDPPPPPPPKPNLVLASETELTPETLSIERDRFERILDRLIIAEKRMVRQWIEEEKRRKADEEDAQLASARSRQRQLNDWAATHQQIERHERWIERHFDLDPMIYNTPSCHKGRGED